jgi:hypothetical protein
MHGGTVRPWTVPHTTDTAMPVAGHSDGGGASGLVGRPSAGGPAGPWPPPGGPAPPSAWPRPRPGPSWPTRGCPSPGTPSPGERCRSTTAPTSRYDRPPTVPWRPSRAEPGPRTSAARTDARVLLRYTESEFAEIGAAARDAGLTASSNAAGAPLAMATGAQAPTTAPWRSALLELMDARNQARRIGANVNQAARVLNSTAHRSTKTPAGRTCLARLEGPGRGRFRRFRR